MEVILKKCRQLTFASKLKSTVFVFGLGPNAGLSLEVGGVILEHVTPICSNWTLIVLGATDKNDMLMLSPFLYICHMLYLICGEQFSGQEGFLYPNILLCGIYQNDSPVYYYAKRQVMMISLLS